MATYKYSDFLASSSTTFDGASTTDHKPLFTTSDSFVFDVESIAASGATITGTTTTTIAIGGKTFIFTNFALGKISATNFTFADGSKLIIGDGTTATSPDASANTLIGTDFDDYLDGQGGSDTVSYAAALSAVTVDLTNTTTAQNTVGAGSDKLLNIENIIGSSYNDSLKGVAAGSKLNGGLGIDTLTGGAGSDTFVVTAGDTVTDASTADSDTVESSVDYVLSATLENLTLLTGATVGVGNTTKNLLKGNSSNNVLEGKGATGASTEDTLTGGDGNDTYIITDGTEVIIETNASTTQIDTVISSGTVTALANNVENLRLIGAISGTGNSLNNIIYASSGSNATLDGGSGTADTLSYQFGATAGVTITLNASTAADTTGSGTDGSSNFEILIGSRYSDTLTGDATANTITGGLGNDVLNGGATAADKLDGGAGNDTYIVDSTTDTIVDSTGSDTVKSSVDFSIASLSFIENVTAAKTGGSITVTGNTLANILTSNSTSGNDTLVGGTGNDTYVIDGASDVVTENLNAGTDTVQVSVTGYTLADNVENLTVLAGAGAAATGSGNELPNIITGNNLGNTLNGLEGNDKLIGGTAADILDGGEGNDNMTGGDGGDTYKVDSATDTVIEIASGTGTDLVQATATYTLGTNVENLTLLGSSAINGTGNDAGNTILGNAKNNILTGGKGADIITGAAGKDKIVLTESTSSVDKVVFADTAGNNGSDTITGFLSGTDTIDLNAVTALTALTTVTGTLTNVTDLVYFLAGQAAGDADSLAAAAAAITAAATWTSAAVTTNIIVVDDNSTAIYEWVEASGNGAAAGELTLMGTIDAVTIAGDYLFA